MCVDCHWIGNEAQNCGSGRLKTLRTAEYVKRVLNASQAMRNTVTASMRQLLVPFSAYHYHFCASLPVHAYRILSGVLALKNWGCNTPNPLYSLLGCPSLLGLPSNF